MAVKINGSVGSWKSRAQNRPTDVRTVQRLLTAAAKKLKNRRYDPNGIDGKISRKEHNSGTLKAIINFQRYVVELGRPDARIDPGRKTWKKLAAAGGSGAPASSGAVTSGMITVTFEHGHEIPNRTYFRTKGLGPTIKKVYESKVTVSGAKSGRFRGSIFPTNMKKRGFLLDGTYPLHLGFQSGGGKAKQTADDLVVRTRGIRAALLVNARRAVRVFSDNRNKVTATGINVHEGRSNTWRASAGCCTIQPADWPTFITLFLDGYPDIKDWHTLGNNTGKKIGYLVIKP
jgi:hypothetical protein